MSAIYGLSLWLHILPPQGHLDRSLERVVISMQRTVLQGKHISVSQREIFESVKCELRYDSLLLTTDIFLFTSDLDSEYISRLKSFVK